MKKRIILALFLLFLLGGCAQKSASTQIAATTLPVYNFTSRLCQDTPIQVTRLVTESVSCLHDYSLNVRQVKCAEVADLIILSGAGLEESFLGDWITASNTLDASEGIPLIFPEDHHHEETHEDEHEEDHHGHHHEEDPHIWLDPQNAMIMAQNIYAGLSQRYPQWEKTLQANLEMLLAELSKLQEYGQNTLKDLSHRELITFHDGFSYFAQAFDLEILEAIEEESGQEASAHILIDMIAEVQHHKLPAIFTERNGSDASAQLISAETGCKVYSLDMAMSGDSYFDAMYHNIDTIKEALG